MHKRLFILFILFTGKIFAQEYQKNISVHDPVIIKQDSVYYIFCTGRGISVFSSVNMKEWKREKSVFDTLPWAVQAVSGFKNHIWAPDISFYKGQYYLYYSISAFGKNTSCIGVATNKTLILPLRILNGSIMVKLFSPIPAKPIGMLLIPISLQIKKEMPG